MLDMLVLGSEESLLGFRLLGLPTRVCHSREEAGAALFELGENGLVFLTDSVYRMLGEEAIRIEKRGYPVLIPLPEQAGAVSLGQVRIGRNIEKAVGADIIGE